MKRRKPFSKKPTIQVINLQPSEPSDTWRNASVEDITRLMAAVLGRDHYTVTDNGDGTKTHTWVMPV